jgi:quercetin dioxygenase-like cupin family protein
MTMTKIRLAPSADEFRIQRSFATHKERHLVQRLTSAILLAALLISLVPLSAVLAQQAPTAIPLNAPPGPVTHFPTRFDVVAAPAHFNQVLLIIDFPAGIWTPLHTPGGYVYTTVIDGEISTRMIGMPEQDAALGQETTYQAGSTFFETPGEFMQVGNATATSARVMTTALLPMHAPLTIYRDGLTSNAYPTLADWYYTRDIEVGVAGPKTVDRSSIEVDRPAGAFELVQLVLDFKPGISTPWHMHGGQELAMVTTGVMTLQRSGAVEVFSAGESWVNTVGLVHAAGNDGTDFAQVVATFLLPVGRPLTTVG